MKRFPISRVLQLVLGLYFLIDCALGWRVQSQTILILKGIVGACGIVNFFAWRSKIALVGRAVMLGALIGLVWVRWGR